MWCVIVVGCDAIFVQYKCFFLGISSNQKKKLKHFLAKQEMQTIKNKNQNKKMPKIKSNSNFVSNTQP